MIPGSGRSAGEGIGYSLKYSWASLVAQLVKNPPVMQIDLGSIPGLWKIETCIRKIPWRREMLPIPVFWPGEVRDYRVHGVAKSWKRLSDFHFL